MADRTFPDARAEIAQMLVVSDLPVPWTSMSTNSAPPSEPPRGGEIRCFLQDPDGHLIELSQTTGPDERH